MYTGPIASFTLYQDVTVYQTLEELAAFHGFAKYVNLDSCYSISPYLPDIDLEKYRRKIDKIKNYIHNGDSYQINLTFRLVSSFSGDPFAWFLDLAKKPRETSLHTLKTTPQLFARFHRNFFSENKEL